MWFSNKFYLRGDIYETLHMARVCISSKYKEENGGTTYQGLSCKKGPGPMVQPVTQNLT